MKSKAIFTAATLFCLGFVLAVFFSSAGHAVASGHDGRQDGGGGRSSKPWDTDNLRYGRYTAKSFNVPFHEYGGYSETACQSGVSDAFFQAGGTVGAVNDFPYLDWDNDSGSWVEKESGARNDGCDEFVSQQSKMATRIVSDGGFSH